MTAGPAAVTGSDIEVTGATPEQLVEMIAACRTLAQEDGEAAAVRLQRIAAEADGRGLLDLFAQATYLHARIEVARGRLEEALVHIDAAREAWMVTGATISALRTDLGRMHVLDDLGEHRQAISVGEHLIQQLDGLGPAETDEEAVWLRAAALENLGVGRGYLGDHIEALSAYEQAEAVYRRLGMEEDIARPMANRGVELIELGRLPVAIEALRSAAVRFEEHGDVLSMARCLVYEARAQLLSGDYVASATAVEAAGQALGTHAGGIDDARMQLVRADTLASLNLSEEALDLYDALVAQFESNGLRHDRAWALYGSAKVLAALGREAEATQRFELSEAAFREIGNTPMEAMAVLGRSGSSRGPNALSMAREAHAVLIGCDRPIDLVSACLRLGELSDTHAAAEPYLAQARRILDDHEVPQLQWQLARLEAAWARRRGDLPAARAFLESAAELIETVRDTVGAENLRLPFMTSRRGVHEDLVSLFLEQGDVEAAFQLSARHRARTLIERMAGAVTPASAARTSSDQDEIYSRLLEANSSLASGLARRARELERAVPQPPGEQPALHRPPAAPGFGDDPTVMFELVGDEIIAFVADRDGLRAIRDVTSAGHVSELLARLDAQWRRFDDRSLAVRQRPLLHHSTVDLLQQLYLALFGPMPWVSDYGSLVVVPVGLLANVPFGALHDGMCHLVERMPVTLAAAPSELGRARPLDDPHVLVMGVEDEHAPWIRTEAESIARCHGDPTLLLNDDATADALAALAPAHDIIHLACHGLNRPDNPAFSALRLGDRWLTAAEIAGMSLDGQLVVLSACSSGRDRRGRSPDEPNGLPRAFIAAGAGAVVVNLWQVDDEASAQLMTAFHRHLADAAPPQALRTAQIEFLSTRPHPYLWAPSVIYGPQIRKET